MKICCRCTRHLANSGPKCMFNKNSGTADGLSYECKDCRKAYREARYKTLKIDGRCVRCSRICDRPKRALCSTCAPKSLLRDAAYHGRLSTYKPRMFSSRASV